MRTLKPINELLPIPSFVDGVFSSRKCSYAVIDQWKKSSIGAKPNTMHVYLKHTNNFIANTVLKCIVKYMNPIKKWEERHPFK